MVSQPKSFQMAYSFTILVLSYLMAIFVNITLESPYARLRAKEVVVEAPLADEVKKTE